MTNILYNPCHPSVTGAVSSINIPHTSKDTEHSSLKTRNRRRMKSGAVSGHFEPRQDVADVASPKRGGPGAESPGKGGGWPWGPPGATQSAWVCRSTCATGRWPWSRWRLCSPGGSGRGNPNGWCATGWRVYPPPPPPAPTGDRHSLNRQRRHSLCTGS